MKIRKILSILLISISPINLLILSLPKVNLIENRPSTFHKNYKLLKNNYKQTKVNYLEVKKSIEDNSFPMFVKNKNQFIKCQKEKAIELQNYYFNLFESGNFSLEEIQTYMCENFPQYKEEYEKQITFYNSSYEIEKNYFKTFSSKKNTKISSDIEDWIRKKQKEFKDSIPSLENKRNSVIIACTVASIAAATFYSLAFWTCGGSIPWAIASTMAATQFGISQDFINKQICIINEYVAIDVFQIIDSLDELKNYKTTIDKIFIAFEIVNDIIISLMWIGGPTSASILTTSEIINKVCKTFLTILTQHFCDIINLFI